MWRNALENTGFRIGYIEGKFNREVDYLIWHYTKKLKLTKGGKSGKAAINAILDKLHMVRQEKLFSRQSTSGKLITENQIIESDIEYGSNTSLAKKDLDEEPSWLECCLRRLRADYLLDYTVWKLLQTEKAMAVQ